MISGNIGSESLKGWDYTAQGDTVNTWRGCRTLQKKTIILESCYNAAVKESLNVEK
jgi:hypothetical protein